MITFGYERSGFVDYVNKNNIALKHLYLQGWDTGEETMPYPPATGQYALYDRVTLKEHLNNAVEQVMFVVTQVMFVVTQVMFHTGNFFLFIRLYNP